MSDEIKLEQSEASAPPAAAPELEAARQAPPEVSPERRELEARRVEIQQALTALSTSDDFHQQAQQHASDLKQLPPEKQLAVLAALAFEKGAALAVRVAERLGNLAVLDQLHDYLVRDDVYPHLDVAKSLKPKI